MQIANIFMLKQYYKLSPIQCRLLNIHLHTWSPTLHDYIKQQNVCLIEDRNTITVRIEETAQALEHKVTIISLFSRDTKNSRQISYHMMEILCHLVYQFLFLFFFCDVYAHDVYAVDDPAFQTGHERQYTQLCGLSKKFKGKQLHTYTHMRARKKTLLPNI